MIIGIAGMPSSGKDTVAEIFEKKGYKHISLSQVLRNMAKEQNIELTTENLTEFGNSTRLKYGLGFLAKEALKEIKGDAVITSIRQPGEVDVLRKKKDFYLIAVDATLENRWQRLSARRRPGDPATLEEMKSIEKRQSKAGGSKDMQNDVVMEMADYYIDNNGDKNQLKEKVDEVMKEIKKDN